jgi:PAS domain S-box-containing protein
MAKHDNPGKRRPRESASRESAIVRYSSDAIYTVSKESVIDSWNPAAERIYGYASEEAVGKPMTLIFPPDRVDEEIALITRLSEGEDIPPYETIRVRKDGTNIEVSLSLSPVKDSSGRIVGSSRIARDISEEKRSRRELEAAHARYKSTLDNMMEGGQILDREFRYVYLNDVAAKHGRMPKDDGLEVLRKIKSDPDLKRVPVVVLTSSREEKDLVRSYDLGVNAFVVKPVSFEEFVDAVKQVGAFWAVLNEIPPHSS